MTISRLGLLSIDIKVNKSKKIEGQEVCPGTTSESLWFEVWHIDLYFFPAGNWLFTIVNRMHRGGRGKTWIHDCVFYPEADSRWGRLCRTGGGSWETKKKTGRLMKEVGQSRDEEKRKGKQRGKIESGRSGKGRRERGIFEQMCFSSTCRDNK